MERMNYYVAECKGVLVMADIRFKERYIGFVFKNFKNPDSYLDYGSFNLGYCEGLDEEFADLTFRFDIYGKLMPDFWDDRDGYHELKEDEQFYLYVQKALNKELHLLG